MSDWTKHGVRVGPVRVYSPHELGLTGEVVDVTEEAIEIRVTRVTPESITYSVPTAAADAGRETYRHVHPPLPPEPR